ncbi:MAG: M67 family metallopeptidase [Candidatus Omnitrophica bacterium]|nr:M67 family metallopeptidase [Candidatus Omnitrophota bacterium]
MSIKIGKPELEDIIAHARKAFPNEACGLLAGKDGRVSKVYRLTNTQRGAMRYAAPEKEQFEAARKMRADGDDMIGIYHSHPNVRPYPSSRDIEMAMHPECSYVIISLMKNIPEVRSFRIAGGLVEEEAVDAG